MLDAGLTAVDTSGKWMGGRYYLQHLVKCVAALPPAERARLFDIYWLEAPADDPFAEVREQMTGRRVLSFPTSALGRLARRIGRLVSGTRTAADLFRGIDVTFPAPLIEHQGVPFVHWMADLQYLHNPAMYAPELREAMQRHDARGVAESARVVVSSEYGRLDAERTFPAIKDRLDVLRFCSVPDESWWQVDPVVYCERDGLREPFFVISNQFTEHKNHLICMQAARILRDRGVTVRIVCTGSSFDFRGRDYFGVVRRFVEEHDLGDRVFFAGLLPREEQIAVLRRSMAVLQPSRFEGWSTIVEDAKSLGKRVAASDFPVHREQLGDDHPWYADPDDAEGWAEMLERLSTLPAGPNAEEESKGREHVARASVECGRTFVSILEKAVHDAKGNGR